MGSQADVYGGKACRFQGPVGGLGEGKAFSPEPCLLADNWDRVGQEFPVTGFTKSSSSREQEHILKCTIM